MGQLATLAFVQLQRVAAACIAHREQQSPCAASLLLLMWQPGISIFTASVLLGGQANQTRYAHNRVSRAVSNSHPERITNHDRTKDDRRYCQCAEHYGEQVGKVDSVSSSMAFESWYTDNPEEESCADSQPNPDFPKTPKCVDVAQPTVFT
jgi:hypothetical protein